MTDPSAMSGILGLILIVAIVAITGLLVEWASERDS